MTLSEAIKQSIAKYMDNDDDEELGVDASKDRKYTKSYFKSFEDELLGKNNAKESRKVVEQPTI